MIYKFDMTEKPELISNHLRLGGKAPNGGSIEVNSRYIVRDGKPYIPIMGEIHFQRVNRTKWRRELLKMKAGGITLVSTYMLWIYSEETEGKLDFSGDNDVRAFISLCRECGLEAVLRIGPWAHGECRNGGFPDWLVNKGIPLRCNDERYLEIVKKWYCAIGDQVRDLMYTNGGNIIAIQLENELVHGSDHLLKLKELAIEAGLTAPIYTVTGWNSIYGAEIPKYDVLPVFGGYPEAPWTGHTKKLTPSPNYFFNPMRNDSAIGADLIGKPQEDAEAAARGIDYELYPYATCELGGGIQVTHHRRPIIREKDIYALSLVKLGSGNNLPGYYMYHGGTNKIGRLSTFNESKDTGYPNDYPILSYDFQAAIGEYGLIRGHYELLKELHLFIQDFMELLAPMDAYFGVKAISSSEDKTSLRCSMRKSDKGGFVFINNYHRLEKLARHSGVRFEADGMVFPDEGLTVEDGDSFIIPFNIELGGVKLRYSSCQLICRSGNVYFFKKNGVNKPEFAFDDEIISGSDIMKDGVRFIVLSENDARHLYRIKGALYITDGAAVTEDGLYRLGSGCLSYSKWENGRFERHEVKADENAAMVSLEETKYTPHEFDSELEIDGKRAVRSYRIATTAKNGFISVKYSGDAAQLYSGGTMIADEYWYGKEWLVPCELLVNGEAELLISELKDDVYLETDEIDTETSVSHVPFCERSFSEELGEGEYIYEVKATVDDMTGEDLGYAREKLESAGAADVYYMPVYMKKNRPGVLITCLAHEDKLEAVMDAVLRYTSTKGLRYTKYSRMVMRSEMESIDTEYGRIMIKRSIHGDIIKEKPEFSDLVKAAEKHGIDIQKVRKKVIKCEFK